MAADAPHPVELTGLADEPWVWLAREASPDYHDQLMTTCRRAGFGPDVHHVANSILTQLAMVAAGLGITLAPNTTVRQDVAITHRPLTERAELVELSLVIRAAAPGPLVEQFLQIATNPA